MFQNMFYKKSWFAVEKGCSQLFSFSVTSTTSDNIIYNNIIYKYNNIYNI